MKPPPKLGQVHTTYVFRFSHPSHHSVLSTAPTRGHRCLAAMREVIAPSAEAGAFSAAVEQRPPPAAAREGSCRYISGTSQHTV